MMGRDARDEFRRGIDRQMLLGGDGPLKAEPLGVNGEAGAVTDPMSGGDAASRGHLNADDGAGGRHRTGSDIDAAGMGAEAPGGDTREQGEVVAPPPIGGSTEADAPAVGGNEPDYLLVRVNREALRDLASRGASVVLKGLVPYADGTFDLIVVEEWRP